MKKIFSAVLAVFFAAALCFPVFADGEETHEDFLLRGNKWGITAEKIVEDVEYTGKTNETDSMGNKWTSENYTDTIDGYTYRVRYDFNSDGRLFEMSYFSDNLDDVTLDKAFDTMMDRLEKEYGKPENFTDEDGFGSAFWNVPTGEISILKISGSGIMVFYVATNYDVESGEYVDSSSTYDIDVLRRGKKWGETFENVKSSGVVGTKTNEAGGKRAYLTYTEEKDEITYKVQFIFWEEKLHEVKYTAEENSFLAYRKIIDAFTKDLGKPAFSSDDGGTLRRAWKTESTDVELVWDGIMTMIIRDPKFNFDVYLLDGDKAVAEASDIFLLRGNTWNTMPEEITEHGTSETRYGNEAGGVDKIYFDTIGGIKHEIVYSFTSKGRLYMVSYAPQNPADNSKSHLYFYDEIKEVCGATTYCYNEVNMKTWLSPYGRIYLRCSGSETQNYETYITAPGFDAEKMDFAAGEGITLTETCLE